MRQQSMIASALVLTILVTVPLRGGVSEFWQGDTPPNRNDRREAAAQFLKDIAAIDDLLPDLSLTQREWLKREYDDEIRRSRGKYTTRSVRAMDSIEYHLASAKPRLATARNALKQLASTTNLTLKREVELWAIVASVYSEVQLAASLVVLAEREYIPKAALQSDPSLMTENQTLKASVILRRVLLPYLQDTLSQ